MVDDGSSDNTEEVLSSYIIKDNRFSFYKRPNTYKSGGNGARNYGFNIAKGTYIKWFDSDDLMEPDLLLNQLNSLKESNKSISVCLFDRYNEDFSVLTKKASFNAITHDPYYDFITSILKMNLQTTLWRVDILKEYVLDEKLKKSQEYDFIQRMLEKHRSEVEILNEVLVRIRRHGNSITGSFFDKDEEKANSSMKVQLDVIKKIDKVTPNQVKNDLLFLYLNSLSRLYKFKRTKLLFKYIYLLYRTNKYKINTTLIKLSGLYVIYFFTNKGKYFFSKLTRNIVR